MNSRSIKDLRHNLTLRYAVALGFIALFSTAAFFSLHYALVGSDSTAYIVNISGKQRMLSQHIALDVYRIYESQNAAVTYDPEYLYSLEQTLLQHTNEFLRANTILSSGKIGSDKQIDLSTTIQDYYFGEMNLASRVQTYADLAQQVISSEPKASLQILKAINQRSEILLGDLNTVVHQYQREGEEQLQTIRSMEIGIWVLTLFTLLLEVIFIFQPMVRRIISLSVSDLEKQMHLEHQVELRTMDLKLANQKLTALASHDPLTGLNNRLFLEQKLEQLIEQHKNHGAPYAVLMMDIDWFKKINDNYGHGAGDSVLVELSNIFQSSVRVGDDVFRSGGEEFVILLERISFTDSVALAEKIAEQVRNHQFICNDKVIQITLSGGLYHSSLFQVSSHNSILKWVDTALYDSKAQGRNRINVVDDSASIEQKALEPSVTALRFKDKDCTKLIAADMDIINLIGYSKEELLTGRVLFKKLVHPDDRDIFEKIASNVSESEPFVTTARITNAQHKIGIFRFEAFWDQDELVVNLQNVITLTQSVKDDLLVYNFHAMMENSDDYIYFKDRYHVFTAASKTLVALTSVKSREELIGKTDYELFDAELADKYFILEKQLFSGEVSVAQEMQPTLDKEGNKGWVDNRKYPIKDAHGTIVGLFGVARVISENECQQLHTLNS